MRKVSLWRIGSDAELLFVNVASGGEAMLRIPATRFVGNDRELTLRSFIGCDGHAATAELRPPPCHNIMWHLMKIANGIHHMAGVLTPGFRLLAQPSFGNETMGGHIWISLHYNSELSARMINGAGRIYDDRRGGLVASRQPGPQAIGASTALQRLYLDNIRQELTIDQCWRRLHWFLAPLEMILFRKGRAERNAHVADPFVRLPGTVGPDDPDLLRPNQAYFRFEYRFPSTWLSSPKMALCYLGLAKLAILNWDSIPEAAFIIDPNVGFSKGMTRRMWKVVLSERLAELKAHPLYRITPDLRSLYATLKEVTNTPTQYPLFVDTAAWERYNYEGE